MEKINKHNYEAYFLDYLEGNLSVEEKQDLFSFLEKNPDLKSDLDMDLNEVSLNPSAIIFENKESLKTDDESILTLNTADAWMLEAVEKNLTASKQKELEDFVRKHQLEKTYTAYQSAILKPDLNLVFEDKKKLKVAAGVIIPIYARVASIAAVVIFLIGISVNQFSDKTNFAVNTTNNFSKTAGFDFIQAPDILQENVNLADVVQSEINKNENTSPNDEEKIYRPFQQIHNSVVINNDREIEDTITKMNGAPMDENKIVELPEQDTLNQMIPNHTNDIAIITSFNSEHKTGIISEEPYKIVTTAASNITNKEISFSRDKNVATNQYVAYGFKVGNFEFERKK